MDLFPGVFVNEEELESIGHEPLFFLIKERRKDHTTLIHSLQGAITQLRKRFPHLYQRIDHLQKKGFLDKLPGTRGDARFLSELSDSQKTPLFVLKRANGALRCYNNAKGYASLWNDEFIFHRVYKDIPIYRTSQAETASFLAAQHAGIEEITPPTLLTLFTSKDFFDLTDAFTPPPRTSEEQISKLKEEMFTLAGERETTCLCSLQEYIPEPKKELTLLQKGWTEEVCNLGEILYLEKKASEEPNSPVAKEFIEKSAKAEQEFRKLLLNNIDLETFVQANLFTWITGKLDLSNRNILGIPLASKGSLYKLKVYDNSWSWGNQNALFKNDLMSWPQGYQHIPDKYKQLILQLPVDAIIDDLKLLLLDQAIEPFKERIELIQHFATQPHMTVFEMNLRLQLLGSNDEIGISRLRGFANGRELAFNNSLSLKDMEQIRARFLKVTLQEIHFYRNKKKSQEQRVIRT